MRNSLLIKSLSAMSAVLAIFAGAVNPATASAAPVPQYDHVVLVMFENTGYESVIGSSDAPYFNALAGGGASFTNSHGIAHPSQPNYIGLFSGDTQGVDDNTCPVDFSGVDNLGSQLISAGRSFIGYSESMPSDGFTGCSGSDGLYRRKHNGWVNFDNVPASSNLTFGSFPSDYNALPSVSFITPNMCNDIHDCPVGTGDTWLKAHLSGYAEWAKAHNSLLIVTFDEDEGTESNRIPTIFYGAGVTAGSYHEYINHYSVLRTIEDAFGLPALGEAATATPITSVRSGHTAAFR